MAPDQAGIAIPAPPIPVTATARNRHALRAASRPDLSSA
ncbi:hypothetical protein ASZ90_016468 [hydrocarbon metagenome]|uniref:Uncharacterized protein n=1 Tax=hydrocarbon metagenome TaxID=938273 RepID=A0A0W8ESG9_9ZZZZ